MDGGGGKRNMHRSDHVKIQTGFIHPNKASKSESHRSAFHDDERLAEESLFLYRHLGYTYVYIHTFIKRTYDMPYLCAMKTNHTPMCFSNLVQPSSTHRCPSLCLVLKKCNARKHHAATDIPFTK